MEFLLNLGLFAAQAAIIVAGIVVVVLLISGLMQRGQGGDYLEVEDLNAKHKRMADTLELSTLPRKARKKARKAKRSLEKSEQKRDTPASRPKIYVLDFKGDIRASAVSTLREEITTILNVASPDDQVLLRLESGGGTIHGYGLAASQLTRIKDAKISLRIAVDKVAASGGYMMGCVADHLMSAPFAIIGSIGVVAQVPNFHRLLKRNDIDYEEITAGEFKRTISVFGEITEKGREKFNEQIDETHDLFKDFVAEQRPQLDLSQVATGEYWFGRAALDLKLVDELKTSDSYLMENAKTHDIYQVSYHAKRKLRERIGLGASTIAETVLDKLVTRAQSQRFL